jgi:hypothetical protein
VSRPVLTKRKNESSTGAMLDLWRPAAGAGEPVGCLATTYTFAPGLFDEQCLARFLEIESEPNREDLAFLLERESRLGSVYAGVLVDYTQAGVEHSLRWDVLPVRIPGSKQHAKLSLLAWSRHVRIIVASANLTEPGYRSNYEVASAIDITSKEANIGVLDQAMAFLRSLLSLVPASTDRPPEIRRAEAFLEQVERQVKAWTPIRQKGSIRQQLVFTLPASKAGQNARGSLEEAIQACRGRGGSPTSSRVASPFFDGDAGARAVTASLCKLMARGSNRELVFCVPAVRGDDAPSVQRLAAPKAIFQTPGNYQATVAVETLPELDTDKNRRSWHAKMLALQSSEYSALLTGSSNFTCAGMGIGASRNAEANLLTIVDRIAYSRDIGQLEAVWPVTEAVTDPASAEWLGAQADLEEEENAAAPPLPAGFLSAGYRAGDGRFIVLRLDAALLPSDWQMHACGYRGQKLLSAAEWQDRGSQSIVEIAWEPIQPPEKILVCWEQFEAFLPLNVEDSGQLPPPSKLEQMSADEMLWILASADPSAAFRLWAKGHQPSDSFDPDIDSATPIDLDPLRRYDLQATFLHRIRRRARILAQLRSNLQRPVWGRQALEWKLKGLIGIDALADRLLREFENANGTADEALLTLADFLIILREVDYQPSDGHLSKIEFEKVFRPFLRELVDRIAGQVDRNRNGLSNDLVSFWRRVVAQCQE